MDDQNHMKTLHHGPNKCHKHPQSVMLVEVDTLFHAFEHVYIVSKTPKELLDRQITLEVFVDSRTLYIVIVNASPTAEGGLQIEVYTVKARGL